MSQKAKVSMGTNHNVNLLPVGTEIFLMWPFVYRLRVDSKTAELFVFYEMLKKTFVSNAFESIFRRRFRHLLPWNVQILT